VNKNNTYYDPLFWLQKKQVLVTKRWALFLELKSAMLFPVPEEYNPESNKARELKYQ
jgi:hypothetical protein